MKRESPVHSILGDLLKMVEGTHGSLKDLAESLPKILPEIPEELQGTTLQGLRDLGPELNMIRERMEAFREVSDEVLNTTDKDFRERAVVTLTDLPNRFRNLR